MSRGKNLFRESAVWEDRGLKFPPNLLSCFHLQLEPSVGMEDRDNNSKVECFLCGEW